MLAERKSANLRTVADRVGLAPCSISAVLNDTPAAKAIPQSTKDRIFRAAAELNYRPNLWARSLRTKRTKMVAALATDFGHARVAQVIAGLHHRLQQNGYLLVLGSIDFGDVQHFHSQFQQRGIEGVIAIDAEIPCQLELPVASVDVGYLTRAEPLGENMRSWLTSVGEAAAETIIGRIERKGEDQEKDSSGRSQEPGLAPAYFDVASAGTGREARESA
jgi:DNA-binding LacI/PurR family transcriptional regulator